MKRGLTCINSLLEQSSIRKDANLLAISFKILFRIASGPCALPGFSLSNSVRIAFTVTIIPGIAACCD